MNGTTSTIKTPGRQLRRSGIFNINSQHVQHIKLELFTLNKYFHDGKGYFLQGGNVLYFVKVD